MVRAAALMALALAGCATDSGIQTLGDNQYRLARQAGSGFESTTKLQDQVYRDAGAYCAAMGKTMHVEQSTRTQGAPVLANFPHAEVIFSCQQAPDKP